MLKKVLKTRRSRKSGLPPGSLLHVGDLMSETTYISGVLYSQDKVQNLTEEEVLSVASSYSDNQGSPESKLWINIIGLGQHEKLDRIGNILGVHSLTLEDILNTEIRPKVEEYSDYLYITLKSVNSVPGQPVQYEQVSIVLKQNVVMVIQERLPDEIIPVLRRLEMPSSRFRELSVDHLAYSVIDTLVDNYFVVLENLGERAVILEDHLVSNPSEFHMKELYSLKGEAATLRRILWPTRELISLLERRTVKFIRESSSIYFRDVYYHALELAENLEAIREQLTSLLDVYLSSVNNRLNNVMRTLTVITTIFMPLTLISGIYGMNFQHMPELQSPYGYPAVILVMLSIVVTMIFVFKKKKWL